MACNDLRLVKGGGYDGSSLKLLKLSELLTC
jgi:hypothetical protein